MNRTPPQRFIAGIPLWGVGIAAFALLIIVAFFGLLVAVSVRAAGQRPAPAIAPTSLPTQVLDPSLRVEPGSVQAGGRVVVSGEGWPADDTVIIGLDAINSSERPTVELGGVVAAGNPDHAGTFTTSFMFPTDSRWTSDSAAMVVARSTQQFELVRWSRVELLQPTPTLPPATPIPFPTATIPSGTACTDKADFVSDVTIPDRTVVQSGKSFDKIWRLRNSGTCTWTSEYTLVFVDGSAMGAPASVALPSNVEPDATVDLKVTLEAPRNNGTYGANWMLRNASGRRFGVGSNADKPFWVKIQVGSTSGGSTMTGIWKGEYFNNVELEGTPALTRNDAKIDFDWKRSAPATNVSADNFSVRWTGKAEFDIATYRFKLTADDGARLYVDGILVIDSWEDGSVRELTAEIALTKGPHSIKLEYYERTREALIRLSWSKIGSPTFSDWRGQYFSNPDLKGEPALERNDRSIDFDWGKDGPAVGLPSDNFSVRWLRKTTFDDGTYRFRAVSDDGVRVYVDGKSVIHEWRDQGARTTYAVDLKLSGQRSIVVEYYEHTGGAKIRFWIERQIPPTVTPSPTEATPTEVPPTEVAPTETPPTTIFDFAANLCQASWSNATEDLDCQGASNDPKGFVAKVDQPALESNSSPSGAAILMQPQLVSFGVIRGVFPAVTVSAGDRFQAVIACPNNQRGCNVVFTLGYRVGASQTQSLGVWAKSYNGTVQTVDVSLQPLEGQNVSFVMTLLAEQATTQSAMYLVNPRLVR